jgi:hypothetical protein
MRRLTRTVLALLALLQIALPAGARETNVMEGINLAVIMPVDLSASPGNAECGLTEGLIIDAIREPVLAEGLLTEHFVQAKPFMIDTPGVYLILTIATLRGAASGSGSSVCTSWIGLRAQSAHTLVLPPTGKRKTVQLLYWDRGVLISGPLGNHVGAATAALRQLATAFGEQWRSDQR